MNQNPKEKSAQILIRTKPKEKEKIRSMAAKCNLPVSEYMLQRALGYEPRVLYPNTFYDFYGKLCELCNADGTLSPQSENALLELIDHIHSALLLSRKGELEVMATTGFWPVKSRLKTVLLYAENPDKTTDKRYLDEDLYAALRYVENDKKTDQTMYVSAINCPKQRAYQCMMATNHRYGKLGGNVAFHGFQSFKTGEATPAEAHQIGLETAKRMWADYAVIVTTHLNMDNIHNHIVVNSVSFKTGRKFENHISDHYRLREISDAVCAERGKSVLPPGRFKGSRKKDYIDIYLYKGVETPGGMPRILDDDLFYRVQALMNKNKSAPARTRGEKEYLLTTKLFCGHCKEMMVGYGGTGKSGKQYHYYMCKKARKKKCDKKIIGKDYIEDRVVSECLKMLTDDKIRYIAKRVAEECSPLMTPAPPVERLDTQFVLKSSANLNLAARPFSSLIGVDAPPI